MPTVCKGALPKRMLLAIILLVVVNVLFLYNSLQVGTFVDDGYYITLARSIAQGHGLSEINDPNCPPHKLWPFGFPLLLSPAALLSKTSLLPYKLFNTAYAMLALVLMLRYYRKFLSPEMALLALGVVGCSALYAGNAGMVMSEPTFGAVFLAVILIAHSDNPTPSTRRNIVIGLLCALAYFIRPVGIACGCAVCLHALFRREYGRVFWVAGIVFICALAWGLRDTVLTGSFAGHQSYLKMMGIDVVLRNLRIYSLEHIPNSLLPFLSQPRLLRLATQVHAHWALSVVALSTLVVLVLGATSAWRDPRRRLEMILAACYGLVLLVWPLTKDGGRLLYPLYPFFVVWFLEGLAVLLGRVSRVSSLQVFRIAAALLLSIWTVGNLALLRNPTHSRIRDISVGSDWIRHNTAYDALVIADRPQSIWLYAQRATVGPVGAIDRLRHEGRQIDYVLVGPDFSKPGTTPPLLPRFRGDRDYQLVFQNTTEQTYVFAARQETEMR